MSDPHTPIPSGEFQKIVDTVPICTVDVLFFNSDKTETLLFRRQNEPLKGTFFSLGGRLLKGESLEDCAVRQAMREAGIAVRKEELTFGGVQGELHHNSMFKGVAYHAIDVFYGHILHEEDVLLDSQHSVYQWFLVSDPTLHPFVQSKISGILKAYGKES